MGRVQSSGADLVAQRPFDVLGSFSLVGRSGTIAAGAAADAPIFSLRWGDAAKLALIHRVRASMSSLGTGFTAGVGRFGLVVARGFTASDAGQTDLTPIAASPAKRRAGFKDSVVTSVRVANTAALTPGVRTLDTLDLGTLLFPVTTATNFVHLPTADLLSSSYDGVWPLVLAQNEGFVVRATVPATGTWQVLVQVDWSEVDVF